MPITKTTSSAVLNESTLAANDSTPASSVLDLTEGTVYLAIHVTVVFGASAVAPCVLEVYAGIDDMTFDNFPIFTANIPHISAGGTRKVTVDAPASMRYAVVKVSNSDASHGVTGVVVRYTLTKAS